jgi:hypothetical protein
MMMFLNLEGIVGEHSGFQPGWQGGFMPSTMWDAPIRSTCHAMGVAGVACAGLTLKAWLV